VGLINAALSLREREEGVQQLAHREQSAQPSKDTVVNTNG
jgi:hypothetical protein